MARYAAFLRGINVGGHRVTADQFKSCFAAMGFEEVGTFRASGNVVFDTSERSIPKMTKKIEAGLEKELGYAVPTFLRSRKDMERIAAHDPFGAAAVKKSKGRFQVLMLTKKPAKSAADEVLAMATDDDLLAIDAAELYWLPSGGTLETGLDFKAIGRLLGQTTARTLGTVEQMRAKYFED